MNLYGVFILDVNTKYGFCFVSLGSKVAYNCERVNLDPNWLVKYKLVYKMVELHAGAIDLITSSTREYGTVPVIFSCADADSARHNILIPTL